MDAFAAIADPTRRSIMELLASGPMNAGEISRCFRISPPAISQHLKVLREAHVVRMRIDAQRRIYHLDPSGLREVDEWLSHYRKFWFTALDALEAKLDADRMAASGRRQNSGHSPGAAGRKNKAKGRKK